MKVVDEGMACVDCVMMIANGELPHDCDEERQKELEAIDIGWCVSGGDEDHDEFSWSSCDVCGSTLGGSRDKVVLLGDE